MLDEMHAPSIADALTARGWDVVAVATAPELRSLPDEDLLAHASTSARALVTENVADFAPLASRWLGERRDHAGLIFTNPRRFNRAMLAYPGNVTIALERLLEDPPVEGGGWIWWL